MVRARGVGKLIADEVFAALESMLSDPAFEPGFPQLCDLREVTEVGLTSDEIQSLAAYAETLGPRLGSGKLAIVSDLAVVYGVSRMYQAFGEDVSVEIGAFRDYAEAVAWLGVDPEPEPRE